MKRGLLYSTAVMSRAAMYVQTYVAYRRVNATPAEKNPRRADGGARRVVTK